MDTIRLVKKDGVVSEQTFHVQVTTGNEGGKQAKHGQDYDIGGNLQNFTITPGQQNLTIPINISDYGIYTGTKKATLFSAPLPSSLSYVNTNLASSTTVVILDYHGGFI